MNSLAARVGAHVDLPSGEHVMVARDVITGRREFVGNQIRKHEYAGTLLRVETPLHYTRSDQGYVASCTLIVVKPLRLEEPARGRQVWGPLSAVMGGLLGTFGLAAIVGWATADDFMIVLKWLAAGVSLCVAGAVVLAAGARTVGSGNGRHCPGCPDH